MEGILQFQLYHHQLVPTGGCIALIGLPGLRLLCRAVKPPRGKRLPQQGLRHSAPLLRERSAAGQQHQRRQSRDPPSLLHEAPPSVRLRVRTSAASIIKSGQKKYNRRLWASFEQNISEINANLTPKQKLSHKKSSANCHFDCSHSILIETILQRSFFISDRPDCRSGI